MLPEDKPITLSVKDFLIKKMAVKMRIPESTIEAVIEHQFKQMIRATKENTSVELSGFGKFLFMEKRAKRYIERMERELHERKTNTKPEGAKNIFRQSDEQLEEDIRLLKLKVKENGN